MCIVRYGKRVLPKNTVLLYRLLEASQGMSREESRISVLHVLCYLQARPKKEVGLLHKTLNRSLQVLDLVVELALAVGKDGASNDRTGDSTGKSKGDLAGHKYIMHVLLFADQGQVQKDLKGLSIGGQDDQISLLAIQCLCSCDDIRIVCISNRVTNFRANDVKR